MLLRRRPFPFLPDLALCGVGGPENLYSSVVGRKRLERPDFVDFG